MKKFSSSLSKDLLLVATDYTNSFVKMSNGERKILHFRNMDIWMEKLTIDGCNKAKICKLISTCILHKVSRQCFRLFPRKTFIIII